jgi:hypothetical protein
MGHRDLLVTHNLSEGKNHERRLYLRGSVRRASGFVLTGKPSLIGDTSKRDISRSAQKV